MEQFLTTCHGTIYQLAHVTEQYISQYMSRNIISVSTSQYM